MTDAWKQLNDLLTKFGAQPVCPICKNSDKLAFPCLKCGRKPKK